MLTSGSQQLTPLTLQRLPQFRQRHHARLRFPVFQPADVARRAFNVNGKLHLCKPILLPYFLQLLAEFG